MDIQVYPDWSSLEKHTPIVSTSREGLKYWTGITWYGTRVFRVGEFCPQGHELNVEALEEITNEDPPIIIEDARPEYAMPMVFPRTTGLPPESERIGYWKGKIVWASVGKYAPKNTSVIATMILVNEKSNVGFGVLSSVIGKRVSPLYHLYQSGIKGYVIDMKQILEKFQRLIPDEIPRFIMPALTSLSEELSKTKWARDMLE